MRKKRFLKFVAFAACFSILSLSVPGLFAVEKSNKYKTESNFSLLFKKPVLIISSFFPFLSPFFDTGKTSTPSSKNYKPSSNKEIRTTGGLVPGKTSDGD